MFETALFTFFYTNIHKIRLLYEVEAYPVCKTTASLTTWRLVCHNQSIIPTKEVF